MRVMGAASAPLAMQGNRYMSSINRSNAGTSAQAWLTTIDDDQMHVATTAPAVVATQRWESTFITTTTEPGLVSRVLRCRSMPRRRHPPWHVQVHWEIGSRS